MELEGERHFSNQEGRRAVTTGNNRQEIRVDTARVSRKCSRRAFSATWNVNQRARPQSLAIAPPFCLDETQPCGRSNCLS